jgi:hypothetical protein
LIKKEGRPARLDLFHRLAETLLLVEPAEYLNFGHQKIIFQFSILE